MNERYIEALKKLKENLDDLKIDFKAFQKEITSKEDNNLQKIMFKVADDLAKYDIKDGYWYYNGKNTGVKAEAKDGKDGEQGPIGPTGKPGKDGDTPNFKVRKVYLDSEGQAKVSMEKEDNTYYLTFTIPQGVQGVMGFPGEDATINGMNTINILEGKNIKITQEGKNLIISSTGGSGGTSDYKDLKNKPKINDVELSGNKTLSDLGIDQDFVKNESDPTVPSHVKSIKEQDIANWNSKVDKNVNDLTNYYNKTYIDNTVGDIESLLNTL